MSIIDQIIGRTNKVPVFVATPEWPELDGKLSVRRLSPKDRMEFYTALGKQEATSGAAFLAFIAVYCTLQVDGSRAFADEDWKALLEDAGSGSAVERLSDAADELNILSSSARESLKKTYAKTDDSASISESQEPSV